MGACRCTGGAPDASIAHPYAAADAWSRPCRELIIATLFRSVQPATLVLLLAATRHALPQVREMAALCVAQLRRIDPDALTRAGLPAGRR